MNISTLRFAFKGFANIHPRRPGTGIFSESEGNGTWSNGVRQKLYLNPGTDGINDYVGLNLEYSGRLGSIKYSFILRDATGKIYREREGTKNIQSYSGQFGFNDFIKRSAVLEKEDDILIDGALVIDIRLQIAPETNYMYAPSPNFISSNMLKLLDEEDNDADVTFEVGGEKINAHKLVLKMNSSVLFNFCEGNTNGDPILIKDATPEAFRTVLRYVYGGEIPTSGKVLACGGGKDLILAADRYGIIGLKLAVENRLVESLVADKTNVVEWLILAHSKNCALLKEYALSYAATLPEDLVNSMSFRELSESPELMTELMMEMTRLPATIDKRYGNAVRNMTVNELRKKLNEMGLDVDGSKEMLISRYQDMENLAE